jgi:hypothetical protein
MPNFIANIVTLDALKKVTMQFTLTPKNICIVWLEMNWKMRK